MKVYSLVLFSAFFITSISCNSKHIEAKREGLLPVKEGVVATFGFEDLPRSEEPLLNK